MDKAHGHIRLTLGNLIAAVAACGLMAAVLPPSLAQLKQRMEPVTCANNLRVCYQGWNVYGSDYNNVWMAPWDRMNSWLDYWGNPTSTTWQSEWPYTMVHFVTGGGFPEGETVYLPGHPDGPWYGPDGRHGWPPSYCGSPDEAPQLQCATSVAKGMANNPIWYNCLSYTYAIMGGRLINDTWRYDAGSYPMPELMTHPSTTVLLHDLGGILSEGYPNAWSTYDGYPTDPHSGTSNYVMCDGHVEALTPQQTTPEMWQSMWTPDPPAAGGTN